MVIDRSAILAVLFGESDAPRFLRALASSERKLMSAVVHLESSIVVEARKGAVGAKSYSSLVAEAGIEVVAFDAGQAEVALDAWRRFGKGRHPAALNLGDCASYALAAVANEALLFKGDDFSKTDISEARVGG
jgi:ribonuclease VapC